MATKQEIAESMTIAQLQDFAAEEGIDLSGLSGKQDIADAVASGSTAEALKAEREALDGDLNQDEDTEATATTSTTAGSTPSVADDGATATAAPIDADDHRLTEDDMSLQPPSENLPATAGVVVEVPDRISPADTAALAEAGQSPADAELRLTGVVGGEERIVKARPEMPTITEIKDATTVLSGLPAVEVIVRDAEGNEQQVRTRPDDAAQMAQRVAAQQAGHPAHMSKGHWSNPNLTEMTEEEKEQDAKNYAARVGS